MNHTSSPLGDEKVTKGAPRLSDLARERILENLFDRRLPAGSFVSQNQLVELLDIPVAPLRDALRVLEAEGILKIHPRSGIEFVKPGLELTKSTYQFRAIIERAAVKIFAETAPASTFEKLKSEHVDLITELENGEVNAKVQQGIEHLERRLHDSIVDCLENPLIESSYNRMRNYLRLVRLERRMTAPLILRSLREHVLIIDACIARDAEAAETALQAHFNTALQRHMGIY